MRLYKQAYLKQKMAQINLSKLNKKQTLFFSNQFIVILKEFQKENELKTFDKIKLFFIRFLPKNKTWKVLMSKAMHKKIMVLKKVQDPLERKILVCGYNMDKLAIEIMTYEEDINKNVKLLKNLKIQKNSKNKSKIQLYLNILFENFQIIDKYGYSMKKKINYEKKLIHLIDKKKKDNEYSEIFIAFLIDSLEEYNISYPSTKVLIAMKLMEKWKKYLLTSLHSSINNNILKNKEKIKKLTNKIYKLYIKSKIIN